MTERKRENPDIILTGDGSNTLFVSGLNEHYHSTGGAIRESRHIYINSGFKKAASLANSIHIFEVGFGTGLNALLTWAEAEKTKKPVFYTSIEAFPLNKEIWSVLNYPGQLNIPGSVDIFRILHESSWGNIESVSPYFTLHKIHEKMEDFIPPSSVYHCIYFDAFSPDVEQSLWSELIFRRIYNSMAPGAALVTFSVKGRVVRTLKEIGFGIEKLTGPPGKRHILRATKKILP